ncbi:hypothetical protein MBLNU457_g0504t1 [Dothideomycetes sp. NU457]
MSGQQRDMMFCHQCEEEWYRDEHGLACPSCGSEFTEIIEPGHDPRDDEEQMPELEEEIPQHPFHNHNPWADTAPDPDEDDIGNVQWTRRGPGEYNMTYRGTMTAADLLGNGQGGQNAMGGLAGPLANIFQSLLGGGPPQARNQGQQPGQQHEQGYGDMPHMNMPGAFERAQPEPGNGDGGLPPNTFIRTGGGQGFQWRVQGTVNAGPPGNLRPRDANNAQPYGEPFDGLQHMLGTIFGGQQPGQRGAFGPIGPMAGLFDLLNPANMQHGDAVYSQEALDRIVSQLMEQNTTGNAPGPATADAIASLPTRKITEKDQGSEGKADCSICMDEAKIGEEVTELPCHHWFHGECVKAWLTEHDTCPHCRQGIMPRDAPADANRIRRPDEAPRHDQMWGQGEGTRDNPWVIPDSPTQTRATGPTGGRQNQPAQPTDNASLYDRMRNAFGGGNGN